MNANSTSNQPSASAQPQSTSQQEEDYLLQLMLLDQQNKHRPGFVPAMSNTSRRPRKVDNVIGNFFVDGEGTMTCHPCVERTYEADASLWPDMKRHIHFAVPEQVKTGEDLHQCFCGYFSFKSEDLQNHLMTTSAEAKKSGNDQREVLAGLTHRIEQVGMHEACQRQLVTFINQQEYIARPE